jgi:hypothetical protein
LLRRSDEGRDTGSAPRASASRAEPGAGLSAAGKTALILSVDGVRGSQCVHVLEGVMGTPTIGWDDVVERFRSLERYTNIHSTAEAMLRLVATLQAEPTLEGVGRNVSHVSLILTPADTDRHVSIFFSEPGGIGWVGQEGFVVGLQEFKDLTVKDRIVVSERKVVTTIREYLSMR